MATLSTYNIKKIGGACRRGAGALINPHVADHTLQDFKSGPQVAVRILQVRKLPFSSSIVVSMKSVLCAVFHIEGSRDGSRNFRMVGVVVCIACRSFLGNAHLH